MLLEDGSWGQELSSGLRSPGSACAFQGPTASHLQAHKGADSVLLFSPGSAPYLSTSDQMAGAVLSIGHWVAAALGWPRGQGKDTGQPIFQWPRTHFFFQAGFLLVTVSLKASSLPVPLGVISVLP